MKFDLNIGYNKFCIFTNTNNGNRSFMISWMILLEYYTFNDNDNDNNDDNGKNNDNYNYNDIASEYCCRINVP